MNPKLVPPAALLAILVLAFAAPVAGAQSANTTYAPKGWELTGIPALNFNADEGFGYGLVLQAYNYGESGVRPYRYTIQPTLLFTTRGKRDLSLFFDAPHLLPEGWRWSAYLAQEQQLATPYYGVGNNTVHLESAEKGANPYYYRFGRRGIRATTDLQRSLTEHARLLVGVGVRTSRVDITPFDSGTTLLAQQAPGGVPDGQTSYARLGLVWDSRDREVAPRRGVWAELLGQKGARVLGGTSDFTRVTMTARAYTSPTERLTLASRLMLQNLTGDVPFYELYVVQGSYKDDEGLGGAGTLRGLPKDRFAGKGVALLNSEVRYRAADFQLMRKPSSLTLTGFVDAGRVWADAIKVSELGSDLHLGFGAGARLSYGANMVIALDVGHSREAAAPIYIGLGYLF